MYDLGGLDNTLDPQEDGGKNDGFKAPTPHPHENLYEALFIEGTADELSAQGKFTDYVAGLPVRGKSEGQHDGEPAVVLNLGHVGRLVLLPDAEVEWVRDFSAGDGDGFDRMTAFQDAWRGGSKSSGKLASVEMDMVYETDDPNLFQADTAEETAARISATHGVSVKIIYARGPGGGWPVVEVTGLRENVKAALTAQNWGWAMDETEADMLLTA